MAHFINYFLLEYFSDESSGDELPWNPATSSIVVGHVIKFFSKSNLDEHDRLIHTIGRLNDLAKEWSSSKFELFNCGKSRRRELEARKVIREQEITRIIINSLVPEVRRFFKVPKLHQLSDEDQCLLPNEILAGFLAFLLEILDSERTLLCRKRSYPLLQMNLTFLLTILGDNTTFQCTELQDVKNLLVEFESLANEAGSFIYSCVFATIKKRKKKFGTRAKALLEKINTFLNEKMKRHCFKFSELPHTATSRSNPLRSFLIVDSLLEDIEALVNGRLSFTIDDIKDQIKKFVEELTFVQTALNEIQMSQVAHIHELKESLIQIREAAHEAEYLIKTHVMGRIPNWYLNLRLPHIVQKVKLNGIGLQEIKKVYNVNYIKIMDDFTRGTSQATRNPEVVAESIVIGFEDNRTKILADVAGRIEELQTISIFGMPGLGKTTIARKLYNDHSISDHFDLRAWCVVSQTYDKTKVLNDILSSLRSKSRKDKISPVGDENVGLEIYQSLKGRRYLIIMDDVWSSSMWDDLRRYFPDDRNRSRILLTSRIKDTAPTGSIFHTPPLLSESQCYDLLVKKVFIKEPCPPELLSITKRIASKCHGLPLAVVVVAGILANLEKKASLWGNVETNLDSYMSDDASKYMKILYLSYEHLPDHLKPCFLYLGMFPEDKEVPMQKVISMWIAVGFVHKKKEKSLENVAEEYLLDLINRSLLMIAKRRSDGGIKACNVHDLLRDMCLRRAEEEKFLKHINRSSIYVQQSHLVLHSSSRATLAALQCRSLIGNESSLGYYLTHMPFLRVIDGLKIQDLSPLSEMERIYCLVHLKYLRLSIPKFPLGICMLVHLEYVHLATGDAVSVPSTILEMVKLRQLCITSSAVFEKSYDSSRIMKNLKFLSFVLMRNNEDTYFLKCSPHLHKLKCICDGSTFPNLMFLNELESLTMKFTITAKCELTDINFPSTIKKLSLYRTNLPWERMSIVGRLSNLIVLKLFCCAFVGKEWETLDDEFRELRFLRIDDISLKQWTTCTEHFPKLECLVLEYVRDLVEIPSELGDIPSLETIEVRHCGYGVERSVVKIEEEQRKYGNEDLKITITSDKWSKDQLVQKLEQENTDGEEAVVTEDEDDSSEIGVDPKDIELMMTHVWVSRTRAIKALKDADGDIVSAIMDLT